MFVVGLTGGIGAGKTRVGNAFKELGITLVDTDLIARDVVARGSPALAEIKNRYGKDILLEDESLNRRKLREIIFDDVNEKKWIESLLHPLIRKQTRVQIEQSQSPYTILVSPLLLESPDVKLCDRILIVDTLPELQLKRTVARDEVPQEQVRKTIEFQMQRQERLRHADDVIDNSGTWEATLAQILPLHQKYLQYAKS